MKHYIKLVNMHKNLSYIWQLITSVCLFVCMWFSAGQHLVNIMIFEQIIDHISWFYLDTGVSYCRTHRVVFFHNTHKQHLCHILFSDTVYAKF